MFAPDALPEGAQRIGWKPLAGSQALALACPAHVILYEGTRGPGKTDAQLMAFRKNVGLGYGRFWRGVIFDREYKNLDDLVSKSLRWFPGLAGPKARWLSSNSDYKWVWETGEELLFRQVKRDADYWNYHGQEFPFLGWNELAKYAMPTLFDALFSCNRSSFRPEDFPIVMPDGEVRFLPEIPLVCFATTNPYGPGHNWVKDRFIDAAEPGQLIRKEYNVFNPRTQQRQDLVKYHVRIFGSYKENVYLAPEYVAELESIRDLNKRKAWLWGDWDIVAGGAFDDVWNGVVHKAPRFKIPKTWRVDRSFDWGSTHPFSVGWWAEANGEECVLPDGTTWGPPPGTLFRIHEWYGTNGEPNEGLKMSAKNVAKGILAREKTLLEEGWITEAPAPGPADNQIRNVTERDTDTIEKMMADEGVHWEASDKSPGSRKIGLQLARDRLEASVDGVGAGLYCFEHNRSFLKYIPTLPRDEDNMDDVDTTAEDHIWDDTRYRVLAGNNRIATAIPTTFVR